MIVCPQPEAAEVGIQILRRGGNAIDAAVASAFVQGIVDPINCGIGGFGQMHIYSAETGAEEVIDFHGKAGMKVTVSMWKDLVLSQARKGFGYVLKDNVNAVGYTSIATPGTVMGLYEGLTRYGTMAWKDVIHPGIGLASHGFTVKGEDARSWLTEPSSLTPFLVTGEAKRIYTKNGAAYGVGEVIVNKDYAETLRRIASEGPDVFYRGDIAAGIIDDMEKNGGFITDRDLRNYKVKIYAPITADYRQYTVASNDAPGGGVSLLELLNIVEGYDLGAYDWRGMGSDVADYIHILAMAMRAAEKDRAEHVGDPDFVPVPTEMLISKNRAADWRRRIGSGEQIVVPRWATPEPPTTTHVSVVDTKGNAVSLTHTLGSCSGVITPGLGFLYNNAMINFDPIPGGPNSIAPGKSRNTQMAPTIALKDGQPYIILGAPGGGMIMSALMQTIVNIVDHEMTPCEAVAHPRIFCAHAKIIDVGARIPSYVCEELEAKGNIVVREPVCYEAGALPQVIIIDRERNKVLGGSDPRSRGIVIST